MARETTFRTLTLLAGLTVACSGGMGRPPKGAKEELSAEDKAAIARVRGKVDGWITWSSSRFGNHDIFLMKTDGSGVKRLTQGDHVDWYSRFDPAGKRILFTRSKQGWVSEKDANRPEKWDLFLMPLEGGTPKRVAENASWGIWIGPEKILFSRGTKVLTKDLASGAEELLVDSTQVAALGGAELQNPHLSPDGKYLALTLRGAMRETGIYSIEGKSWAKTGEGCQVNWFPGGDRIYWINPSGNGGSETFSVPVADGKPTKEFSYGEMRFVDIPGRQSHEYFPQLDSSGKWLVWAATRRGHDHDIADYDIHIWEVGSPPEHVARLTFHSGNDRWPDIFIPAK
jgi:Tol biopolymer transport system component